MSKLIDYYRGTVTTNGTQDNYEKGTITVFENTGKTPIRIDKIMVQVSAYHTCTAAASVGVVVSLSDMNGACFDSTVTAMTVANLETLLNTWKDFIWQTDFRFVGSGNTSPVTVYNLEGNTKRLLEPGQKVFISILVANMTTEAAKSVYYLADTIMWYSQAAQ